VLISVRDVTNRKQRQRKLEWERELNRTLQTSLVEARSREELEDAVTGLLVEFGYALAWIGEANEHSVRPLTVAGDSSYVDTLTRAESDSLDSEPSVWAARRKKPQFVQDFEDLFPTGWRDAATDHGYHAGGAVPLTYNDVTYGVLTVYHESAGLFDETERQLLIELADTVSFALHTLETTSALAADRVLDVTLQIHGTSYYLTEVLSSRSFTGSPERLIVTGTVPHGQEDLLQYVRLDGIDATEFHTAAMAHPAVEDVSVVDAERTQFQITVSETTPEAELASFGAVVTETTVDADRAEIQIELAARDAVSAAVDTVEQYFDSVNVVSCVERDRSDAPTDEPHLTDKQAAALEAAYHQGYFEQPRGSSATEIAERLDITHSTFLQHLRTAQQKVFRQRYE
jgi:predicted DNA binding protein